MRRSLAERSGREYPHNAIYEILTYRMDDDDKISEPVSYPEKVVNAYADLINSCSQEVLLCYVDVYEAGLTLEDTAKRRKCSPTKVRKNLNEVYFVQDSDGFLVNRLREVSRK